MKYRFSQDTRKVFTLAIPAALKSLVDILQSLIDMIMVGTINFYALAAVGVSMQFMMILNVIMALYVIGGNALIARFIGNGRKRRASSLLYALGIFAIILSIFVSFLGYFSSDYFYKLLGAQQEVIELGSAYFKILCLGMVVIFLDALLFNALSAAGDTKTSLYIKLVSSALNACLNYVLIFGHFGAPALGVKGAAIATVIAYTFNVIAYIRIITKPHAVLNILPIIRIKDLKRAWHVGWSGALERGISSMSFLFFVSIITRYGSAALAGYQVGLRVEGIAFMPGFGFSIAAMALVGQNLGAKDKEKAYNMGIISGRIAYTFMGTIGFLIILFPDYIVSLFTKDAPTILVASQYLILVGLAQIPLAIVFVYSASLRGAGATRTTLKINILSLWLFRIIPSYTAYKLGYNLLAVFVIMNAETLIKGVIYWYIYKKRTWLNTKV
jgi:putative MATE family efflux protein